MHGPFSLPRRLSFGSSRIPPQSEEGTLDEAPGRLPLLRLVGFLTCCGLSAKKDLSESTSVQCEFQMNVGLTNLHFAGHERNSEKKRLTRHRLQFLAWHAMFNFIQDENSKIFKICTVFSFFR